MNAQNSNQTNEILNENLRLKVMLEKISNALKEKNVPSKRFSKFIKLKVYSNDGFLLKKLQAKIRVYPKEVIDSLESDTKDEKEVLNLIYELHKNEIKKAYDRLGENLRNFLEVYNVNPKDVKVKIKTGGNFKELKNKQVESLINGKLVELLDEFSF